MNELTNIKLNNEVSTLSINTPDILNVIYNKIHNDYSIMAKFNIEKTTFNDETGQTIIEGISTEIILNPLKRDN